MKSQRVPQSQDKLCFLKIRKKENQQRVETSDFSVVSNLVSNLSLETFPPRENVRGQLTPNTTAIGCQSRHHLSILINWCSWSLSELINNHNLCIVIIVIILIY